MAERHGLMFVPQKLRNGIVYVERAGGARYCSPRGVRDAVDCELSAIERVSSRAIPVR